MNESPRSASLTDHALRWFPLVLAVAAVALMARRAAVPLNDPDVWWHLRLGQDLWDQGSLRAPADWSPRASVDWVPSEPLPEVVAARLEHWGGLPALAWLYGASMVVVALVLLWACRRRAGALTSGVVGVVALVAMLGSLTPRPQLVSFALLPLVPIAWERAGTHLRAPWWLVPLTWFWSLCHGFWVLGLGVSGLCWLGLVVGRRVPVRTAARLALVPLLSGLVVLLNPAGWEVVLAPLSVNDTAQYIVEWSRTSPSNARALVCAALLVGVAVLLVLARRERGPEARAAAWTDWLLLAASVFFWWYSLRTVAVAAVLAAPVLARRLDDRSDDPGRTPAWRREGSVVGIAAAVVLVALAVAVPHTSDRPEGVPSALAPELDALPDGTPVLNAYGWGGWLSWRHPGLDRTSDGLVVPYDPDYVGRLSQVEGARGDWLALVPDLEVDYALFPSDEAVTVGLEDAGWAVVAERGGAVLLARPGVDLPEE